MEQIKVVYHATKEEIEVKERTIKELKGLVVDVEGEVEKVNRQLEVKAGEFKTEIERVKSERVSLEKEIKTMKEQV